MTSSRTLTEQRDALLVEGRTILERAERSGGVLDDADEHRFDEIKTELERVNDRIERFALVERGGNGFEHGDGATAPNSFNITHRVDDSVYDTTSVRSLGGTATLEGGRVLCDRAKSVIETWGQDFDLTGEMQESASRLVRHPDNRDHRVIADMILRQGSPTYVAAFRSYMLGGWPNIPSDHMPVVRAAMNEGTTTQGGFAVPVMLDPTILLSNAGIANPFRQICDVVTITTQSWRGVSSAGVTAEWAAEAAEVADASPTIGQPLITPVRGDAYVQVSRELLEDTNIGVEIAGLFADARDNLEGAAFAVGTGSTQPYGVVTELNLVTASRVASNTNGAFGSVDVFALDNSMAQRFRPNASWLGNKAIFNLVRQMATGSGPQFAFWSDFGGGNPSQLIGYNVYESSAMQSALSAATASSDTILVLGDFRKGMKIVDRAGMEILFNPLVLGSNRRPSGEAAYVAFFRTGSRVVLPQAFRMLVV